MKLTALVTLDGSEFSRTVLTHVSRLLDPSRYRLVLLRVAAVPDDLDEVFRPPGVHGGWSTAADWTVAIAEAKRSLEPERSVYLERVWDGLKADLLDDLDGAKRSLDAGGYDVRTIVRFGDAAQEIIDAAARERVDLIAMATHGRSGLGRLVIGSVAGTVLRSVAVPVLMARPSRTVADETLPVETASTAPA